MYVCAPAPLQLGVARGLMELGANYYEGLARQFLVKRDMICGALSGAGMSPFIPQGAYYVLADISAIPGENSKEKALHLLQETGVASVPGSAFYHGGGGESLVRFCFAKDDPILVEACDRIGRAGAGFKPISQ